MELACLDSEPSSNKREIQFPSSYETRLSCSTCTQTTIPLKSMNFPFHLYREITEKRTGDPLKNCWCQVHHCQRIYHLSLDKILAYCIPRGDLFHCELLPLRKYRTLKSITTFSSAFHCHLLAAAILISLFKYLDYWVSIVAAFKSKVLSFLVLLT